MTGLNQRGVERGESERKRERGPAIHSRQTRAVREGLKALHDLLTLYYLVPSISCCDLIKKTKRVLYQMRDLTASKQWSLTNQK